MAANAAAFRRHQASNFDHFTIWYPKLSHFTFRSSFIPLSCLQSDSIVKVRNTARNIGAMLSFIRQSDATDKTSQAILDIKQQNPEDSLSQDQKQAIGC